MNQWLLEELNRNPDTTLVRFDVDQYQRLSDCGIIPEEIRCELWDGIIVLKDNADSAADRTSMGVYYAGILNCLHRYFTRTLIGSHWSVSCRSPIELSKRFAPEPDLAIIRGDRSDYFPRFPGADAVQLVIEIAEATLPERWEFLISSYVRHGVPEFWILNLPNQELEVHDEPQREHGIYTRCRKLKADDNVELRVPGMEPQILAIRTILDATIK